MESYFEKYDSLLEPNFQNFIVDELLFNTCKLLPDNLNHLLRVSVPWRHLIGEGSHRHISSTIRFHMQPDSMSQLRAHFCKVIIIERLPTGVFADPFELQHLLKRGGSAFNCSYIEWYMCTTFWNLGYSGIFLWPDLRLLHFCSIYWCGCFWRYKFGIALCSIESVSCWDSYECCSHFLVGTYKWTGNQCRPSIACAISCKWIVEENRTLLCYHNNNDKMSNHKAVGKLSELCPSLAAPWWQWLFRSGIWWTWNVPALQHGRKWGPWELPTYANQWQDRI